MRIAICMPTRGRAAQMKQRVNELLQQALPAGVELFVVLAVCDDDQESKTAVGKLIKLWHESDRTVVFVSRPEGSTAVDGWNRAYRAVADLCDWFVLGADDIVWGEGWLAAALELAASPTVQLIGLNDGHTPLEAYAPHYMASAAFCQQTLGDYIAPSEYHAWWFDRLVCELAQDQGVYAPGWQVMAEHRHPDWQTAEMDATYEAAMPLRGIDRRRYETWQQRRQLTRDMGRLAALEAR